VQYTRTHKEQLKGRKGVSLKDRKKMDISRLFVHGDEKKARRKH